MKHSLDLQSVYSVGLRGFTFYSHFQLVSSALYTTPMPPSPGFPVILCSCEWFCQSHRWNRHRHRSKDCKKI